MQQGMQAPRNTVHFVPRFQAKGNSTSSGIQLLDDNFGSSNRPLGGDRVSIGSHFHYMYQKLAEPTAALTTYVATRVAMLTPWVAMRSQEALQGAVKIWQ
jgi:hypothetical protein